MNSPLKNTEELLSGMLDGTLTEGESTRLDQEMELDPSLKARLDDFIRIRRSLLVGRTKANLGPDFAKNVTRMAKFRANQMGSDAPDWLVFPKTRVRSWRPFAYAGLAAMAAAFLIAVFVPSEDGGRRSIADLDLPGETIVMADPSGSKETSDAASKDLAAELLKPTMSGDEPTVAVVDVVRSQEAAPLKAPETPVPDKTSSLAISDAVPSIDPDKSIVGSIPAAPTNKPSAKPSAKPTARKKFFYTMVLDVSIDPIGIENRSLENILERNNIAYTDDLNISDEQLKNLVDSQLVGSDSPNVQDTMGVLFLRASFEKLNTAVIEIVQLNKDFPECSLSITTDKAAERLVKQLSLVKVSDGKSGVARRLSLSVSSSASAPFAASARLGTAMGKSDRDSFKGELFQSNPFRDELANLLILTRPAK